MMTKNLENLLAQVPLSCATKFGQLRAVTVEGKVRYLTGEFANFPYSRTASLTTVAANAGISIGTGDTAATADDYQLEETVTSGVSLALSATTPGTTEQGAPALTYKITVTNTGAEELVIREIGYKQTLKGTNNPGGVSTSDIVCLLDRTVLPTPVTIQAGDAGVIEYTLVTDVRGRGSKGGVALVDFTWGSDEDVAAMIAAAHAGTIDLQEDGGWRVGDLRTIHVDAWTGGGSVAHAAQDINIMIASFEDYNECGCVVQFDFADTFAANQRMNGTATTVGGYSASEMYTTTLPALVEALPEWLKDLLLEFDVLVGKGNNVNELETVQHNKLALRSESEVNGTHAYSVDGEGSQAAVYSKDSVRKGQKPKGKNGAPSNWWFRSPATGSSSYVNCYVYRGQSDVSRGNANNTDCGLSPFGCI